jgi:hypothetical protein
MMHNSSNDELIRLTSSVRYRAVGEEGVLVHLENGRVIVVNPVGLHIVQLLGAPITRQALAVAIAAEFHVTADQAESDLQAFLAELDQEQVLERGGA